MSDTPETDATVRTIMTSKYKPIKEAAFIIIVWSILTIAFVLMKHCNTN